jgi:hypothetical protein
VPATERVFSRTDSYTMPVGYDDGGALVFNGDERSYLGEPGSSYEYWVTVPPHQFDALRRALAADVLDLVCAHVGEVMARGERTWLDDHGIERGFRSY